MSLVLRVDVDKPFGTSSFINRVKSKLSEDYWFPKCKLLNINYLNHLNEFIRLCNHEQIKGYFYFRMCTIPNEITLSLLSEGGHIIGLHAENTKDINTFQNELIKFEQRSKCKIESFTKHGSGDLKLGKYHYAPYEPEKYLEWSQKLNLKFSFGNGICQNSADFEIENDYFPRMFWIEGEYRNPNFSKLTDLIQVAKIQQTPILIHPCNYITYKSVKDDFLELIRLAKEHSIKWELLNA